MGKPSASPEHYSIIYSGREKPKLQKDEDPDGTVSASMQKAIRVKPTKKHGKLHPKSRLNYHNMHTIDQGCRVLDVGDIHPKHLARFRRAFTTVLQEMFHAHLAGSSGDTCEPEDSDDDDSDSAEEAYVGSAGDEGSHDISDDNDEGEGAGGP